MGTARRVVPSWELGGLPGHSLHASNEIKMNLCRHCQLYQAVLPASGWDLSGSSDTPSWPGGWLS